MEKLIENQDELQMAKTKGSMTLKRAHLSFCPLNYCKSTNQGIQKWAIKLSSNFANKSSHKCSRRKHTSDTPCMHLYKYLLIIHLNTEICTCMYGCRAEIFSTKVFLKSTCWAVVAHVNLQVRSCSDLLCPSYRAPCVLHYWNGNRHSARKSAT